MLTYKLQGQLQSKHELRKRKEGRQRRREKKNIFFKNKQEKNKVIYTT
jgi:hypothetical protein